jgi:hypothetical protein
MFRRDKTKYGEKFLRKSVDTSMATLNLSWLVAKSIQNSISDGHGFVQTLHHVTRVFEEVFPALQDLDLTRIDRVIVDTLVGVDIRMGGDPSLGVLEDAKNSLIAKAGIKSHGLIGPRFAVIQPRSREGLITLLEALDNQSNGRYPYSTYDYVVGKPPFFTSTDKSARKNHSLWVKALRMSNKDERFINIATEELINAVCNPPFRSESLGNIVRNVLARFFLGAPAGLTSGQHSIILANSVSESLSQVTPPWARWTRILNPALRARKKAYRSFATAFVEDCLPNIEKEIKHIEGTHGSVNSNNLFIHSLLGSLSKEKPLEDLRELTTEQIRRHLKQNLDIILLLLVAGENLTSVLTQTLIHLASSSTIQKGFFGEHDEARREDIIRDHYERSLSVVQSKLALFRYTDRPIHSPVSIPAKTQVVIPLGSLGLASSANSPAALQEAKELVSESLSDTVAVLGRFPFLPFSAGPRSCVGFKIGEYLYNAIMEQIYIHYEEVTQAVIFEEKPTQPVIEAEYTFRVRAR